MADWQAHNDAHSRQVFMAFKEALSPLMANVAPDWLLHHIEMRRSTESHTMDERVEIRLVIKPIGQARFGGPDADLLTGHKRLPSNAEVTGVMPGQSDDYVDEAIAKEIK